MSLDATGIMGIEPDRLHGAYEKARAELLAQRDPSGHWIGELAASALSTATAVSAMACMSRDASTGEASTGDALTGACPAVDQLIDRGIQWLAAHQGSDGGWGDTQLSHSNV